MRILIDIGHPAHVHLFKNFAWKMQQQGHVILFTCREKEFETSLLNHYGFEYKSFGRKYITKFGKILGLFVFDLKEYLCGLNFKPDLFLSHGSMYAAHAAFILGKPHISLEDTGNSEQVRLYLPFTSCVITSDIFPHYYGLKQIRVRSHHELAYLHPNYFQPDPSFRKRLGLDTHEEYVILRFVAWNASHDVGQGGLSYREKIELIRRLAPQYRIFISSEGPLPREIEKYKFWFPPYEMHDALYNTRMFIGEGTTMAMEAAILGTQSVYINSLQYWNVDEMQKYGLLYNLSNVENRINKILDILSTSDLKNQMIERRQKLLSEKADLTEFLYQFINNYPKSLYQLL